MQSDEADEHDEGQGIISLWSLPILATVVLGCAATLAGLRRLGARRSLADAAVGLSAAVACIVAGVAWFAASAGSSAGTGWRNAGAACFLAFPVVVAAALPWAAKKRGSARGSVVGAFLGGTLAVALVVAWATFYLKGARGGWSTVEILVAVAGASGLFVAAACFGWWCGWGLRPTQGAGCALFVLLAGAVSGCAGEGDVRWTLTILDHETGQPTPARVTLQDDGGGFVTPREALPIFADCGQIPFHNWAPFTASLQAEWGKTRSIQNPFRGSEDFYSPGELTTRLPPGHYRLRVEKGPEYGVVEAELDLTAGEKRREQVVLRRWIDLPARGWYSSDDHLHLPRPHRRFDPRLAAWMQAEDIHVANLLQMGLSRDVHITPQRAFGPRSLYRSGRTLLVGGQENPRTHVLGHAVVLAPQRWIDHPEAYLDYGRVWREARRQGALTGYAHFAMAGAHDGLAVWGPERLLDFIEVLNLGFPYYKVWYEALDLGIPIVPTAGSDYPCVPTLPGRERFYTKLDGDLSLEAWLDAVRRGRTFVTNGPMLELAVEGAEIGDELVLAAPRTVTVTARVRFDPTRDRVERLEIVRGGEVIAAQTAGVPGALAIDVPLTVSQSTWLAARVSGTKIGERPVASLDPLLAYVERLHRKADRTLRDELGKAAAPGGLRPSSAHTGPIYVRVEGTPPIADQPRARQVAASWIQLLDDLAARLADERIAELAGFPGAGDGVTLEDLRKGRAELLRAIDEARATLAHR